MVDDMLIVQASSVDVCIQVANDARLVSLTNWVS